MQNPQNKVVLIKASETKDSGVVFDYSRVLHGDDLVAVRKQGFRRLSLYNSLRLPVI